MLRLPLGPLNPRALGRLRFGIDLKNHVSRSDNIPLRTWVAVSGAALAGNLLLHVDGAAGMFGLLVAFVATPGVGVLLAWQFGRLFGLPSWLCLVAGVGGGLVGFMVFGFSNLSTF